MVQSAHPVAQEITVSGNGNIYRSWQNVATSYTTSDDINTIWGDDIMKVFSGEMTAADMLADVAATME